MFEIKEASHFQKKHSFQIVLQFKSSGVANMKTRANFYLFRANNLIASNNFL